MAIFHVRIAEATLRDHANVEGYVSVGWAGPLTINDFMKVVGVGGISRFHSIDAQENPVLPGNRSGPVIGASIAGSVGK